MPANSTDRAQDRATPGDRSTEFVAVEETATESSDAATLMVTAYVLMWLCTVVFVLLTWRKLRGLETRLSELGRVLDKSSRAGD